MDERNVLVVEDDPALSELVGGLLVGAGYSPITITDHDLIGTSVERWHPRCVILDGETGWTGESRTWSDAAALRSAYPSLPVVLFTGDGDALAEASAGDSRRSRDAAFAGIVSKPFVVEQFLASVKSAVERAPSLATTSAGTDAPRALPLEVFPDVGRLLADWPETDLFSTVVHELRQPLTVMRGQLQLARRRSTREPARALAAVDIAFAQVERMERSISDLLDQARLASNGLTLQVVDVDLRDIVAEAVRAHEYGATPRIRVAPSPDAIRVRCDPARVAQIVDNLLSNALKYSADDAPIDIAFTALPGEAEVRVCDRGVGIPTDERARLFAPFYRGSRTRGLRGTGLGLHIARRLAERQGGRLWLDASSEAGSVFALALPLAA